MATIRWGIIGVGNVTEVKSGPGFRKARNSSLVAVMRRNAALAEDYARRHGVPKWYDDAQRLIDDPEVDAVYIATPPDSHASYTQMVAAAGKPVYVEKPMGRTLAECETMIEACRLANVPLFVAYYRRAMPRLRKIKELVDAGAVGEVRSVQMSLHRRLHLVGDKPPPWRVVPEIAGGGHFVDLASHMLDFLDYVLGPIREARGFAVNQAGEYPAEDHVAASFTFESGVVGVGDWCFSAFQNTDRTEIVGTQGKIVYSVFDETLLELVTADGTEIFAIPYPEHVQQPLIQTIVDQLNGEGICPSTGDSAIRATRIMDQLLAEYRAGASS
jgi:1,5-anhydro-D-fructose reductase (1,5-anhydro-D-mannitol-forming)